MLGAAAQPAIKRDVEHFRAVVQRALRAEVAPVHNPGERHVLEEAHRVRLHDAEVVAAFQNHPEYGRLRHGFVELRLEFGLVDARRGRFQKTRAIVVEHALDARVAAFVDGKRGEFGEVAAFRVAAHVYRHIAGQRGKHARHVCRGGFLRRNHRHVAQVEVFLPARNGAVGSAER